MFKIKFNYSWFHLMLQTNIRYIIDSINNKKTLILIRYSHSLYSVLSILEKEFRLIKSSFIFRKWIFIRLLPTFGRKRLHIKIFNSKLNRNFFSYKKLRTLSVQFPYIVVYSSKNICSAYKAIQKKHGGILCFIIY